MYTKIISDFRQRIANLDAIIHGSVFRNDPSFRYAEIAQRRRRFVNAHNYLMGKVAK